MALAYSMVVVCGASATTDSVRRALWLPRTPDRRLPMREVLRLAQQVGTLALTAHDGYVLVHGLSALTFQKDWLQYSADGCRVLAFRLVEGLSGSSWALYEDGQRTRVYDERMGRDEGARRPFEPPPDPDETPASRLRAIYTALTEREVGEDLDLEAEVDAWTAGVPTPPAPVRSASRDVASR